MRALSQTGLRCVLPRLVSIRQTFHVEGAGSAELNNISGEAQRADVSFEGIGAGKGYASEHIGASVQGMGSLDYFGNPRVINKTVEGIGSVRAGR